MPQEQRWADLLEPLPTLSEGQACNLKVDTGELRVWLSRCGLEDGEPFARTVYVEQIRDGRWQDVGYFDGDEPDPTPWPTPMADAWRATLEAAGS